MVVVVRGWSVSCLAAVPPTDAEAAWTIPGKGQSNMQSPASQPTASEVAVGNSASWLHMVRHVRKCVVSERCLCIQVLSTLSLLLCLSAGACGQLVVEQQQLQQQPSCSKTSSAAAGTGQGSGGCGSKGMLEIEELGGRVGGLAVAQHPSA
jgi:hypothetical protein